LLPLFVVDASFEVFLVNLFLMFFCVCPRSRSVRWSKLEHVADQMQGVRGGEMMIIFVSSFRPPALLAFDHFRFPLNLFFFWSKRLSWSFSKVPSILPIAQKEEEKEVHWTLTFEKFCF